MDAVAPALIGLGLFLMYEAWESHKTGSTPAPLQKVKTALGNLSSSSAPNPGPTGTGPVTVNPNTGQAYVSGYPVQAG